MKMKNLFLSFVIVLACIIYANLLNSQDKKSWDDPNIDRVPYHIFNKQQNNKIIYPDAVVITSNGYDNFNLGVDFAEPHTSVNPLNPLQYFAAYNSTSQPGIGTYYTMDGYSWQRNNPSFPGIGFGWGDPVTAYDSLGTLYFENMYGDAAQNIYGTKIAVSTDNGLTWSYTNGNTGNDKNWIAADQTGGPYANYVYATMTNGASGRVIRSTDRGQTFNYVATLTPHSLPGMMPCVGPRVAPGVDVPGGCVYIVTNSGNQFASTYTFFRSSDGGASFQAMSSQIYSGYVGTSVNSRSSVENMRTRAYPFITADNSYGPFRGRLYLVYATNDPPGNGNKPDIFCRYSTDQGVTFSSPIRINDDPNPSSNHQWFPSIWCDKKTGRLFVKWLDTRNTPTSDSCDVYASYSDNGGISFVPNVKITTAKFKINCTSCNGGTPAYLGDYDAVASNGKNGMIVWTDFRAGTLGSYTAFYPDYGMVLNPVRTSIGNNDSAFFRIVVPSVKSYTDGIKFTAQVDTVPSAGTLQISFVNNKDSISAYPDSVTVRIRSIGSVTPKMYRIIAIAKGPNGIPVHKRIQNIFVNVANVSIGTNREGVCDFKVNGSQYNTRQNLVFNLGSSISVQALSPKIVGGMSYTFSNWSDAGDTTHNVNVNGPLTLTANYKIQYKLILNSSVGNSFGGNIFYDSAVSFQFGVLHKIVSYNGQLFQFRGWTGAGSGAYTSPDSTGNDSTVTISMMNAIIETARWQQISGINNLSSEIPDVFKLYQNYPNPFNPVTNINFDVAKTGKVRMVVYDILGKEIEILADDILQAGKYSASFNADKLSSGIYFYRLEAPGFTDIKRMIVLK